ncbi:MAG: hypothetical protein JW871_07125 [Endomicrobiales bacterium]|nr:hypothetical protein [Endomicrobiales bacterium]
MIINLVLLFIGILTSIGKVTLNSPYLSIAFYYYIFLYLPGYFLAKVFFNGKEINKLEMIPLSLCLGYIVFAFSTFFAYSFKLQISLFSLIYCTVILLWMLIYMFYVKKIVKFEYAKLDLTSLQWLIIALIAVTSFLMADYFGGFISGNFLVQVSGIRKLVSNGIIEQRCCFIKDSPYSLIMYHSYNVFLAMISYLSKNDPVKIWIYLPQFILPIGLIANFCFARRLFNSNKLGIIYFLIFFSYNCLFNIRAPAYGAAWFHSEFSACHNFTAMGVFMPIILIIIMQYLKSDNKKLLILLPSVFLAQGSVHLYVQSKTYFILFTLFFWALLIKPYFLDYKKLFKVVLFSSFGLILFFYGFLVLTPNINPAYSVYNGPGGGYPVNFYGKWPLTDMKVTIFQDPFVIIGTIIFLFTLPFVKASLASFFVFTLFFTVYFVLYNPFMMRFGGMINPMFERITRLHNIVPFCIAMVIPFEYIYRKRFKKNGMIAVLLLIGVLFVLLLQIKSVPERLKKIVYTKEYSLKQLEGNKGFHDIVKQTIPDGSIVLVDLPYTTWWTTYFPHYIVAHTFPFVFPPNIDPTQRHDDVEYFYKSPFNEKSREIVSKYNVDYVVFFNKDMEKVPSYLKPAYTSAQLKIFKVDFNNEPAK